MRASKQAVPQPTGIKPPGSVEPARPGRQVPRAAPAQARIGPGLPGGACIQAKLQISQPDDPLELQADRAAEQVMRMPAAGPFAPMPRFRVTHPLNIQRLCTACEEEELQRRAQDAGARDAAPPAVDQVNAVLRQRGRSLDASAHAFFEPRFGVDLGGVRIHTDSQAVESARAVNALAYTVGSDVVFNRLQRQCACGTHTAGGGTCAECDRQKAGLQRKLAVGASNDVLEAEADQVAATVVQDPVAAPKHGSGPLVQRRVEASASGLAEAPASVERALASAGVPLPQALRHDMQRAFGHDFAQVRVHTGALAERSAQEVDARAYTVGPDIFFGRGSYAPDDAGGRRLLAHELAHVVQQGAGHAMPELLQRDGPAAPAAPARACTLELCWAPIAAYHLGAAGQVHGIINLNSGTGVQHLEVDPSQHRAPGIWHSHVADVPGRRAGSSCQALPATCAQVTAVVSAARDYESRDVIYDPTTVTGPNSNSFVEWALDRGGVSTSLVAVPTGATGWGYFPAHPPQRTDPPHVARTDPRRTRAPVPRSSTGTGCTATFTAQRTAAGFVALVREATTRLTAAGIASIADHIKILRGLYYGTPWSRDFGAEHSLSRIVGFQAFTLSGVEYPRDPVSILDCGLYDALQRSQDVTTHGVTVDIGHLLIGLDAREGRVAGVAVPNAPMPTFGGSGIDVTTWLGDLGGGAASLARDRALRSPSTPVSAKFSGVDYGGPSNLEGDIAAYVVARGGATAVAAPAVPAGSGLANLLGAYLSPATSGGSADWGTRATTFLRMFGGAFGAAGALTNEPAMIAAFGDQIESFACAYIRQRYAGAMSEAQLFSTCDHVRSCALEVGETFVHALMDATASGRIQATRFPSPTGPTPGACLLLTAPIRARRAAAQGAREAEDLIERARRAWEDL